MHELESGSQLESGWVEVSEGTPLVEAAVSLVRGVNQVSTAEDVYVPLVSDQWRPGLPVSMYLFVRSRDRLSSLATKSVFRGVTTFSHLPGEIRTAFNDSPFPPAKRSYVLTPEDSPGKSMSVGWFFLKAGGLALGIFCPCYLIWRRRYSR
jgi:hypothetical protein